jgi:AraC-like DNA-binding protein
MLFMKRITTLLILFIQLVVGAKADNSVQAVDYHYKLYLKTRQSNPTQALGYLQLALNKAQSTGNAEKIAEVNYHKGYMYRILGYHTLALQNYLRALNYYEKSSDRDLLGWLLIDIGNVYYAEKINLSFAIDHYNKAKLNFEAVKDTLGIIVSDYCNGLAYKEKKDYNAAILDFKKSVLLSRKIKKEKDLSFALNCLGQTYVILKKPVEAQQYFKESLQISKSIADKDGLALTYNNMAEACVSQGNFSEAIAEYKKALNYLSSIPDKPGIAKTLQKISIAYNKLGDLNQALSFGTKGLMVADSFNIVNEQEEILPLLAEFDAKMKQPEKAYQKLQRYINLKGARLNTSSRQIEVEYESQLRTREANLQAEKHQRQRIITFIAIGGFLLLAFLLAMIYMKNKDLKDSFKSLYDKHLSLTKKEEELTEIKRLAKTKNLLKEELNHDLFDQLTDMMESEKVFLDRNLSLDELAKKLNTNRTYLSQCINDQYHSNFSNYINGYRIKEAQKIFMEPTSKLLTIEAIAQNVGFNSKSSFNNAFKKFTGLTPSDFLSMGKQS